MMRRYTIMKIARTLVLFLFVAAMTGRVIGRSGTVEVFRNNSWMPLIANDEVNSGEKVRTGGDSSATLQLGSGQLLTLGANSELQITDTNSRIYVANGQRLLSEAQAACPNYYVSPYVVYGNNTPQPVK
jgi:hypothetical protein